MNANKIILALLIAMLFVTNTYGQTKNINLFGNDFWYNYIDKEYSGLKLSNLKISRDKFYFRLWFFGEAISSALDIYSVDGSKYFAKVTNITKEYINTSNQNVKGQIYGRTININPDIAFKIYQLIRSRNIIDIPTGLKINGWSNGNDGVNYLIEYSDHNNYTFKEYWEPDAHRDVHQAKVIQTFVDEVYLMIDMKKLQAKFVKDIPFRSYHADGIMIGTKVH